MSFIARLAISPPLLASLAGGQPPSTFLRSSAVCKSDGSPALFHAGTTWGSERAWYVAKMSSRPVFPKGRAFTPQVVKSARLPNPRTEVRVKGVRRRP